MRDLVVVLIFFGVLPMVFIRPYIGVYLWSWIGYMNPHRLGWGFATNIPFAAIAGVATIVALLFDKDRKPVPWNLITVIWALLLCWMTLTALFAIYPDLAFAKWMKVVKIQAMVLITFMLIRDRERINGLIWIIVLSIGFYSVKGGLFAIQTAGQYKVWGPPGSFIEDNNQLALAIIMIIPLMWYLSQTTANKWARYGLRVAIGLSTLSVFASYSRGALLAIAAIAGYLMLKSRNKLPLIILALCMVPAALYFMPDEWSDRMSSIKAYEADGSAMSRIRVWGLTLEVAKESPIVGAGFGAFSRRGLHNKYQKTITGSSDASRWGGYYIASDPHSIYFLILGEHGFVGIALFLLLLVGSFFMAGRINRLTKDREDLHWARQLGLALQTSLIGYGVGGAFLGLSYFDLYYHLIALTVVTRQCVLEAVDENEPESESALLPGAVAPG